MLLLLLLLLRASLPKLKMGCACGGGNACALLVAGQLAIDAPKAGGAAVYDEDGMGEDWVSSCDDGMCEVAAGGEEARTGEEDKGEDR